MIPIVGVIGCLAFLVIMLFWRINRYERQVLIYHNRMNRLLNGYLATLSDEQKEAFLEKSGISPETWKEPLE